MGYENIEVRVGDLIPHTNDQDGDYLVGLDNGYVVEVDTDTDYVSLGYNSGRLHDGMVLVTFHDRDGDENYLILNEDHPINVKRRTG